MVEGKKGLQISSEDLEAEMRRHMRGVVAGEEGKKPFKAYVLPTRVPFTERLMARVRGILRKGDQ